jgi:hypothetical protein
MGLPLAARRRHAPDTALAIGKIARGSRTPRDARPG